MILSCENLSFSYGTHEVLREVRFGVEKGEFLSLLGPNGVGKSTLFRCMLGTLTDYKGSVLVEGQEIRTLSQRERARRIAYIPQIHRPTFGYTVLDTVLMGTTRTLSPFAPPKQAQVDMAMAAMERVGVTELAERNFAHLSGGEQQMLAIARGLMAAPKLLMLDEPSMGLAPIIVEEMFELIAGISRKKKLPIMLVEQNAYMAFSISDRAYVLENGNVTFSGTSEELISSDEIRKSYLGSI